MGFYADARRDGKCPKEILFATVRWSHKISQAKIGLSRCFGILLAQEAQGRRMADRCGIFNLIMRQLNTVILHGQCLEKANYSTGLQPFFCYQLLQHLFGVRQ